MVKAFQDTLAEFGRETELGEDLVVGLDIHLGKTREQALEEVQPYFEENIKMFAPLGFVPRLNADQSEAFNHPSQPVFDSVPKTEEYVDNGHYQFGTPQYLIDELGKLQDTYPGLEQVTVQTILPLPKTQMFEQMQWFAEEVMPEFLPD